MEHATNFDSDALPSLYERTGRITDFNTLLIPRHVADDLSRAPKTPAPPPSPGVYWEGQGGIYCGILPAFDGHPLRHLIASAEDAPTGLAWSTAEEKIPGAESHTDGRSNTAAMLAASASSEEAYPAAKWASEYEADGHQDFHLPSPKELFIASLYAPQNFSQRSLYWTSAQAADTLGFAGDFIHGRPFVQEKKKPLPVRAFRWIPL